jgi:hypothetical protein
MWASAATPKQTMNNSQPTNRYVSSAPAPPPQARTRRQDRVHMLPNIFYSQPLKARRSSPLEPNALRPKIGPILFQDWARLGAHMGSGIGPNKAQINLYTDPDKCLSTCIHPNIGPAWVRCGYMYVSIYICTTTKKKNSLALVRVLDGSRCCKCVSQMGQGGPLWGPSLAH